MRLVDVVSILDGNTARWFFGTLRVVCSQKRGSLIKCLRYTCWWMKWINAEPQFSDPYVICLVDVATHDAMFSIAFACASCSSFYTLSSPIEQLVYYRPSFRQHLNRLKSFVAPWVVSQEKFILTKCSNYIEIWYTFCGKPIMKWSKYMINCKSDTIVSDYLDYQCENQSPKTQQKSLKVHAIQKHTNYPTPINKL